MLGTVKNMQKIKIILKIIGVVLVLVGLILNPVLIGYFFSPDKHIAYLTNVIIIIIFECICLLLGLAFYFKSKYFINNYKKIILLIVTIVICLIILEIILKFFSLIPIGSFVYGDEVLTQV